MANQNINQDKQIAEQAAQWLVALSDDSQDNGLLQQQYMQWQQAHPEHAKAAQKMEALLGKFDAIHQLGDQRQQILNTSLDAGLRVTEKRKARSRKAINTLALLAVLLLPGWIITQIYPPAYLLADLRTDTGEWQQHMLEDGSQLSLGSRSAVSLEFNDELRQLKLVTGEILVDVAKDASRPFVVQTPHGQIQALGTRFMVRHSAQQTRLIMLESAVQIDLAKASEPKRIQQGEQATFNQYAFAGIEKVDANSWQRGWDSKTLLVDDMPLTDILTELDRYQKGRILFNRKQLESLQISAVLPLDKPDQALELLLAKFPQLQIRVVTPYLKYVSLAD